MQNSGVETIELEGEGGKFSLSFSNTYNFRDHIMNVVGGDAYIFPRGKTYKPTLILDVGANIGASMIFMRNRFPGVPIICYEPAADNLAFLRINSKQAEPVEIIPCALSDKEGTTRLYHGRMYGLQNSIHASKETDPNRFEEVKVLDAAKELASRIIPGTLLKMDTEGCELEILRAISSRLNDLSLIFLEFHSETDRREIDRLLEKTHTLFSGKITDPYRGSLGYLNTEWLRQQPQLQCLEIRD